MYTIESRITGLSMSYFGSLNISTKISYVFLSTELDFPFALGIGTYPRQQIFIGNWNVRIMKKRHYEKLLDFFPNRFTKSK